MDTEIGTPDNYNNFAIGPMPEPSKYLNHNGTDKIKPGPKPGKAQAIKERERLGKEEKARFRNKEDIYAEWKALEYRPHRGGFNRPCFGVYSCGGNRDDCVGYVEEKYYDLICYHCLEEIVKEHEESV
jgi:hypothetical protein